MRHQAWPADRLERVTRCPACDSPERSVLYEGVRDWFFGADGFWTIAVCKECGSAYPDPRPDSESIGDAYRTYYTHAEFPAAASLPSRVKDTLKEALRNDYLNAEYGHRLVPALPGLGRRWARNNPKSRNRADRYALLLQKPWGNRRFLDVGCGNGDILARAAHFGWDVEGIEPDPSAVAICSGRGLRVIEGLPTPETIPVGPFEAVCLSHVIEHLPNPVEVLSVIASRMAPGGRLYIETPNIHGVVHKHFGADWRGLEVPRHLIIFSIEGLRRVCAKAGLDIVRLEGTATLFFLVEMSNLIKTRRESDDMTLENNWDIVNKVVDELSKFEEKSIHEPELADIVMLIAQKPLK